MGLACAWGARDPRGQCVDAARTQYRGRERDERPWALRGDRAHRRRDRCVPGRLRRPAPRRQCVIVTDTTDERASAQQRRECRVTRSVQTYYTRSSHLVVVSGLLEERVSSCAPARMRTLPAACPAVLTRQGGVSHADVAGGPEVRRAPGRCRRAWWLRSHCREGSQHWV